MNEITKTDLAQVRRLKAGAIAAPVALTVIPMAITLMMLLLAVGGPPVTVLILFAGIIATVLGFATGVVTAAVLTKKRSVRINEMKELMSGRGIRADEIEWFRNELKTDEKRTLKGIERRDLLLGDAYRETLASRLTASRIIKSSKRELMASQRRQNAVKQLRSGRAEEFQTMIGDDIVKLDRINNEARMMLAEAESRLRMIEAAGSREGSIANSELTLKKLSSRAAELPLALESAKMTEEIRMELEKEGID